MATATEKNFDKIEADLTRLQKDIMSLTKAVSGDVENGVDRFSKAANEKIDDAATYLGVVSTESKERAANTVKANPLASLAAAAGVGFIIGALVRK